MFYIIENPPEGGWFRVREALQGDSPREGEQLVTRAQLEALIAARRDPDSPIRKEDLIRRAIAAGKYAELRTAIAALTNAEQFYFTHVATFTKDDPVYVKIKAELAKL